MLPDQINDNLVLLTISSAAGAVVRAVNPSNTDSITNKVCQGIVGVMSSVFLGPFIGGLIEPHVSDPTYAIAVSGFICGISGIEITKLISMKVFK